MHKLIVASVAGASSSGGGGGGVESRGEVEGTGMRAGRMQQDTHMHTHTHTHAGCRKTLGKVNLLI